MSDEIFDPLDFTNFDICVNCIKRKQTNKRIFEANRTSNVLKLIHIDICISAARVSCAKHSSRDTRLGLLSNIRQNCLSAARVSCAKHSSRDTRLGLDLGQVWAFTYFFIFLNCCKLEKN